MQTAAVAMSNPTRFGYKFTGWTWENQKTPTTKAVLESGAVGDKHFVAHWQGNPHTVTLNANGGSVSTASVGVVFGSEFNLPTPTKTGYVFKGWSSSGTTYSSGTWKVDKDVTVTASWTAKNHAVHLNAAGGICGSSSILTTYDASYTLPKPTRRGYTFLGWFYNGVGFSGGTWKTDAEISLTASWLGNTYAASLNANGGSVSVSRMNVIFGNSYSFPTPTRKGYDFTGWTTSSYSYSYGTKYASSGIWSTDSNVTLYAQWEESKYTLFINPNGGTFSGSTVETVTYGEYVYLGYMYRTGYTFDGWYYGGTLLSRSSFTYDYEGDITVTASWTPDTYKVTLYANGGSGIPGTYTFTYGQSYYLPTPTRDGYTFDGWYSSSYSGTLYASSGTWNSTSNPYSLYAHWTQNPTEPQEPQP